MFPSILAYLLGAWILSLFGFDNVVTKGMKELFDITITSSGYYLIFGLFGLLQGVFSRIGE